MKNGISEDNIKLMRKKKNVNNYNKYSDLQRSKSQTNTFIKINLRKKRI